MCFRTAGELCSLLENIGRYYQRQQEDDYQEAQLDFSLLQLYAMLSRSMEKRNGFRRTAAREKLGKPWIASTAGWRRTSILGSCPANWE